METDLPAAAQKRDAEIIMKMMDKMPKAMRELVHEYGFTVVYQMRQEGHRDADELGQILVRWRARRQDEWLATDYVFARLGGDIVAAVVSRALQRGRLRGLPG